MSSLPNFGVVGFDTVSLSRSTDVIEFRDGLGVTLVYRTETGNINKATTQLLAWGIEGQDDNALGATLESVTLNETEEVATHEGYTGNTPGAAAPNGKLTYIDGFLILTKRVVMTVSGFGALPTGYEESKHGSPGYSLSLGTAVATGDAGSPFTVSITDAILMNPKVDKTNIDWWKFTFELQKVVATTYTDAGTHLIEPGTEPSEVTANSDANWTLTMNTTLSSDDWARKEVTYEMHHASDQADDWS